MQTDRFRKHLLPHRSDEEIYGEPVKSERTESIMWREDTDVSLTFRKQRTQDLVAHIHTIFLSP